MFFDFSQLIWFASFYYILYLLVYFANHCE